MSPYRSFVRVSYALVCSLLLGACGVRSALSRGDEVRDGAVVQAPVVVLPPTLAPGRATRPYAATLGAEGGIGAPYSFDVVDGALPRGLSLSTTGEITGTPIMRSTATFVVRARDLAGNTGERTYTLVIEGPHWVAYTTFVSSSSSQTALDLLDYTDPAATPIRLIDGRAGLPRFSPDGRFMLVLSFRVPGPGAEAVIRNAAGDALGPPVLLDDRVVPSYGYAWSPDSRRIAYIHVDGTNLSLWVAEISEAGVESTRMLVDHVGNSTVRWPSRDVIAYRDDTMRATLLRFTGDTFTRTLFDVPKSTFDTVASDGSVALFFDTNRYYLGDTVTGAFTPLTGFTKWDAPPDLRTVLGRDVAGGPYALYRVRDAILGASLAQGDGFSFRSAPRWANTGDRVAFGDHGRIEVVDFTSPSSINHIQIGGAYGASHSAVFASDDSWILFSDATTLYGARAVGSSFTDPELTATLGAAATIVPAPSVPRVLVDAGSPVLSRVIDLDSDGARVREASLGLTFAEDTWSADATHYTVVGASSALGRVLYLVDVTGENVEARLVTRCSTISLPPSCPNGVVFQPWGAINAR